MADREGRLEDRPRKIKGLVLPFDALDAEPLLQELVKAEMIVRYEVDGVRVIGILNFKKHQRPHVKESASILPPYKETTCEKPGKGRCSPGKSTSEPGTFALNPESLILNPEGLNPESGKGLSQPVLGEGENRPPPENSGDDVSAWLARQWMNQRKGAHTEHDRKSADNFQDLISSGIAKETIEAEIHRKDRPKTEPIWQFVNRLMPPKVKNGDQHAGAGRIALTPEIAGRKINRVVCPAYDPADLQSPIPGDPAKGVGGGTQSNP